MSRRYTVVLVIGLSAAIYGCTGSNPSQPDTAADEAELRRMQDREVAALASGNIDSLLENYTDDVVLMPPDQPMANGAQNVRAMMEGLLAAVTPSGRYESADVQVVGDVAIVRYTGELTMTPKDTSAAPVTHRIKGLHIYERQPDGTWKIAQDVWNNDPGVPPAVARF